MSEPMPGHAAHLGRRPANPRPRLSLRNVLARIGLVGTLITPAPNPEPTPADGKPAGKSWRDHLAAEIARIPPDDLVGVTNCIATEIGRHYSAVTMPIAPTAPHPITGLSWAHCLGLVHRGTLDGYRLAADQLDGITPFDVLKAWHQWAAEVDDVIESGRWSELGHPTRPPASAFDYIPKHLPPPHLADRR